MRCQITPRSRPLESWTAHCPDRDEKYAVIVTGLFTTILANLAPGGNASASSIVAIGSSNDADDLRPRLGSDVPPRSGPSWVRSAGPLKTSPRTECSPADSPVAPYGVKCPPNPRQSLKAARAADRRAGALHKHALSALEPEALYNHSPRRAPQNAGRAKHVRNPWSLIA